jgi:two-component system chemotaxis response regulator CheY
MGMEDELKILIVEDAEAIRHNISQGLRALGFKQVTCVSNGQAALEFLQVNKADVVLSDWYMEPINGLQLLKQIRGSADHSHVVFIMLSGETAKAKVIEAIKSGIDGYIVKPFTVNAIGIQIHEALKRQKKG